MTFPAHVPVAAVTRGNLVESVHFGSLVVLGADSNEWLSVGDPQGAVYARSSLKLLQAVAMLRHGFTGNPQQVALACASHSGERFHLDTVTSILADAGLTEADLQNTPDLPIGVVAHAAAMRAGLEPSSLMQNCSGKHAAMLATCRVNGWPTASYLNPGHPLQQAIAQTLEDLMGEKIHSVTFDGCGAPVFAFSLTALARSFAHVAREGAANPNSPEGQVYHAMCGNPAFVGGTDRDVTDMMIAFPGLITKDGAEAVEAGAFADGSAFAVKVADGGHRARTVLSLRALDILGYRDQTLTDKHMPKVLGHGKPVGIVTALV